MEKIEEIIEKAVELEEEQRYEKALAAYQLSLETYGSTHVNTITCINHLAVAYFNLGNYQKAKDLFELCLEIRKLELGKNHPSTLISLNNLVGAYSDLGA